MPRKARRESATGIYHIMIRGINREEIAAFGDADNDIDMLQYAGIGIAMENASEGCKAAADYITTHHAENGVSYGVREILKLLS